jgi:hypothetical protein
VDESVKRGIGYPCRVAGRLPRSLEDVFREAAGWAGNDGDGGAALTRQRHRVCQKGLVLADPTFTELLTTHLLSWVREVGVYESFDASCLYLCC